MRPWALSTPRHLDKVALRGSAAPPNHVFCTCLRVGVACVCADGDISRAATVDNHRHLWTDRRCIRHPSNHNRQLSSLSHLYNMASDARRDGRGRCANDPGLRGSPRNRGRRSAKTPLEHSDFRRGVQLFNSPRRPARRRARLERIVEPLAYVVGAAIAVLVAVLASLAPARRAASVQPMVAMRSV
jgi:hypothetical protein